MEDEKIVQLYFQRDELAIKETAAKYGAFCHRIALNVLGLREDAEECVNDTYHAAWNRMPPELPESLRAFLGRITRNLAISRYRINHAKKRYHPMAQILSELDDCIPSVDLVQLEVEHRQLTHILNGWLDTLTADDCALFVRRYWFGDSVNELAKACGVTPGQMAQRMLRLRRHLKKTLEMEGVSV